MTGKKNTGEKDAGKAAAGRDESEISTDIIKDGPIAANITEIKTVEDLEILYPQLVSEIRDEVIEQVEKCSAKALKENMPELYERILTDIQGRSGPNLNVPGFLLEIDDPVAAGTLRAYQRLKGLTDLRLPYVLPFKDKATKAALENYILRAEGSGNYERAEAAHKAMEKTK